nr:MAG TPA: hypothetical protein [Caudoviricetes sp.]
MVIIIIICVLLEFLPNLTEWYNLYFGNYLLSHCYAVPLA